LRDHQEIFIYEFADVAQLVEHPALAGEEIERKSSFLLLLM